MPSANDLDMCLGDFNGHIGRHIDGFAGARGGYGVGQRNIQECYWSFVLRKNYARQIHGVRERKRLR